MGEHVNKSFITRFLKKGPVDPAVQLQELKLQKQKLEEELKSQEKKKQLKEKQKYISEFYSAPRSKFTPVLKEADTLAQYLSKCFKDIPRKLNENLNSSAPGTWIMQNTPQGIFYVNKDTGQWMNALGVVANTLEELLHATGEDTDSHGISKPTVNNNNGIIPDEILPTPTSALDYAVWATTFYTTIPDWNTPQYSTLAIVPSVNISGNHRALGMTSGSDVDYNSFKANIETIPQGRRVMNAYYFWQDIPFYTTVRRDYYKHKADGVTYLNERFITPWMSTAFSETKQNFAAILNNLDTVYDVDFDYIHDDKETLIITMDLVGQNYYDGTTAFAPLPGTTLFGPEGIMPDARAIGAIISDPRFNSEINPYTGKSAATSIVDYYKMVSDYPGYTGTAEQLLSKWTGITLQGDFCFAGEIKRGYFSLAYAPLFRESIPTPLYTANHIENENDIKLAFRATMADIVYSYYSTRYFTEALNENPRYSDVKYYNYEAFTVNSTESEYYRDSNDYKIFNPEYPDKIGGKGWYGWNGNIIWNTWVLPTFISGYVTNPTTDDERYRWMGHVQTPYQGPGTLVRYAGRPASFTTAEYNQWSREVAHKQFIDDIKNLRHMHRSNTNFWNTHVPYVTANSLEFTNMYAICSNDDNSWNKRYFNEFMYHLILHGVLHINLFNGSDVSTTREVLQDVLDEWRVISNNSRTRPCSNATGDINSLVDRLLIGESVTNMVVSGGKLLKSNRYLWRLTASHHHVRSNNTIVLGRVGAGLVAESDLPDQIIIDCSDQINGYGTWIKRNISTPPQYVIVPEPEPA